MSADRDRGVRRQKQKREKQMKKEAKRRVPPAGAASGSTAVAPKG